MNDHASRHLVTTALSCVGALSVAVLCECGCDCACVVQSDRKKKRVGACVGKRNVKGKLSTPPPTIASHSTNPSSSEDPRLVASSKEQIKKPSIAPYFVGSVSTLIVQRLMDAELNDGLSEDESTYLALGIHRDTGSLCFETTTPRDANALAWLMDQGASQAAISDQARVLASSVAVQSAPLPMNRTFAANGTNEANAASIRPSFAPNEASATSLSANLSTFAANNTNKANANTNTASFGLIPLAPRQMKPTFASNEVNAASASLVFIPSAPRLINPTFAANDINILTPSAPLPIWPTCAANDTNAATAHAAFFDLLPSTRPPLNPTFVANDTNVGNAASLDLIRPTFATSNEADAASFHSIWPTFATDEANAKAASFGLIPSAPRPINPTFAANEANAASANTASFHSTRPTFTANNLTVRQNHQLKVRRGKRKKQLFTKCAFTSALSCDEPSKRMMCAASSNQHHCEVMVKCMQCSFKNAGSKAVYRCCRCYSLLQKVISEKNELMRRQGITIYPIPALETLLATPWTALAEVVTREDANTVLKTSSGLSTLGDHRLANNFCLQWDDACPSCFQCDFDDPPPAIGNAFSSFEPSTERTSIVLHDCEVLNDITGEEIKKDIHIDVISCAPLMSSAESDVFKFRAADECEHSNYRTFVPSAVPCATDPRKVEYWQLIRSSGMDSHALSFIRIGCLNSIINNKSIPETITASNMILSRLRNQSTYRKKNSKKAPATLSKAINKVGLAESSIRVNRVGGPMGHAGGMAMSDIRQAIISPYVSHALPRNCSYANIVVPLQLRDLTVAFAAPYYIGVRKQEELAAASPPHNSIPRRGFVSKGAKVLQEFQSSEDLPFLRVFTSTVYSGARILRKLALAHPHLTTSPNVVKSALQTELTARQERTANILDELSEIGNYTAVFDVTFGHKDSFKRPNDPPILENKVSFPLGEPDQSFNLDGYLKEGRVPPGALAYPRYKVASVSFAASDVELHCLHSDMHFGSRLPHTHHDRFRRGSWLRLGQAEPIFFPNGAAVLDWS